MTITSTLALLLSLLPCCLCLGTISSSIYTVDVDTLAAWLFDQRVCIGNTIFGICFWFMAPSLYPFPVLKAPRRSSGSPNGPKTAIRYGFDLLFCFPSSSYHVFSVPLSLSLSLSFYCSFGKHKRQSRNKIKLFANS